jgi:N-acetylmuramoyl-L-alanine amidase
VQPVKRIYLKKEQENFLLCIDFSKDVRTTPRIHRLSNGVKIFLSFDEPVVLPPSKTIGHHLIRGCFFEKFSPESLIFVASFKKDVIFTGKEFSQHSIKIGFRISKKRLIAIDAGHGGEDSGMESLTGDHEKNITLVTAVELRNLLMKNGKYNVVLVRDSDVTMPTRRRIIRVNSLRPKALISIHTNCSSSGRNVRGISVYALPPKETDENGRKQNNHTVEKSKRLARAIVGYVPKICRKSKPRMNSELLILKSKVPAVLMELGCASDPADNELLHSKSFRERVCRAIMYALDGFFKKESHETDI